MSKPSAVYVSGFITIAFSGLFIISLITKIQIIPISLFLYVMIGSAVMTLIFLFFGIRNRNTQSSEREALFVSHGFAPCLDHCEYLQELIRFLGGHEKGSEYPCEIIEPKLCEHGNSKIYFIGINESKRKIENSWVPAFVFSHRTNIASPIHIVINTQGEIKNNYIHPEGQFLLNQISVDDEWKTQGIVSAFSLSNTNLSNIINSQFLSEVLKGTSLGVNCYRGNQNYAAVIFDITKFVNMDMNEVINYVKNLASMKSGTSCAG